MMADLARLPRVEIDKDVEAAAFDAQRELANVGYHRLALADVMVAADGAVEMTHTIDEDDLEVGGWSP